MARNNPVAICAIKHTPSKEPKFHHVLILVGVGRSIKAPLAILIKGWDVRMGLFIYVVCRSGPFDTSVIFTATISVISRYSAIKMVILPLGWLYSFLVISMVSFLAA